jgi:two-component system NarL family sensor kinase
MIQPMRLKTKIILLPMLPLLASTGMVVITQYQQEQLLSQRQAVLVRSAYMDAARNELRHSVALALSTISPLYNTGRNDDEIKRQAMRQLAALDYGSDGYFFLYDFDGTSLMHPRQPEQVGRNLLALRDREGRFPIEEMRDKARSGGGFVEFSWNKPSIQSPAAKIAYVTSLERWNWWFGTGLYIDDIDQVVAQLERELTASAQATMRWTGAFLAFGLLAIFGGARWLSMHELRAADANLTLLARQVVNSQEAERAHLARELHDGTSQTLVSVKLLTEAALERLPPDQGLVRQALERAVARLQSALVEVRGISHRLRPVMLDTLGLEAALQQMGDEMWGLSTTRFSLQVDGDPVVLPEAIKTVLFRVTQEALTNIQRHAGATWVEMHMAFDNGAVRLRVQDNGRGFEPDVLARDPQRGFGLRNMRERMASIGGSLELKSEPGATTVTAAVPQGAVQRFSQH